MKKLLITITIIFSMWCSCCLAVTPTFNGIDYKIKVNSNGVIEVNETWNIKDAGANIIDLEIQAKDVQKSNISNIKVFRDAGDRIVDFVSGEYTEENIKTGNYSVYYEDGGYKILCGIGRYKEITVSYKLNNVLTLYNDCADFELKLLESESNIKIPLITGEIYYPSKIDKTGNINAWLMSANVNSDITTKDSEKIIFETKSIDKSGLRLRVVMPNSMFNSVENFENKPMKDSIVTEEKNLSLSTQAKKTIKNLVFGSIEGIILLVILLKTFKYIKESGKAFSHKPTQKMKYSRELPFNGITPGQATFIKDIDFVKVGNVFSAALLNMKLKGVIDIVYTGESNNLENTFIKVLDFSPNLDVEEQAVFDFLIDYIEKFQKVEMMISLKMLQKYIARGNRQISKLKEKMLDSIKISLDFYDMKAEKIANKRVKESVVYVGILILSILIPGGSFSLFSLRSWISIISVINLIFCIGIATKINRFNEQGVDYREQLKAFERYMLEFSNFRSKGVPEISVWEYYLIFAMSFGISKKVLMQIKACYPNIEESAFIEVYNTCRNIEKCDFKKSFLFATSAE